MRRRSGGARRRRVEGWDGEITKGHEDILGGDGYVHFLDCGGSFMCVYIFMCVFQIVHFYVN